jgi:hypothetical protein
VNTCQLCETPLEDGMLCVGCTKATRVRIEALPALYRGLEPFLAPPGGASQERGAKPVYAPLPVVEDILDLRGPGGIVGVVGSWLAAIRADRQMSTTVDPASALGVEGRLLAGVTELIGHLPWVAVSWPGAGEFAADIREVTRSVSSIVQPSVTAARSTRIGNCPAQFEDGVICGAVLRLGAGERVVTCEWCRTSYPPATWAGLKEFIDGDARTGNAA